jgi:phosphinothricin acetyltransferase
MITVRNAQIDDIAKITEIYNEAVANTFATFDEEPTTVEERTRWFEQFSTAGPHRLLVATPDNGDVVGYAGSMAYRHHPAFAATVEFTVYLDGHAQGSGVGSKLYEALIDAVQNENVHCIVVGIALPNEASIALHRRFGFSDIGIFREYAEKKGKRVDSLWMQRLLADS